MWTKAELMDSAFTRLHSSTGSTIPFNVNQKTGSYESETSAALSQGCQPTARSFSDTEITEYSVA